MTARNYRSKLEGILLSQLIECPVCGEKARSFRIRRVTNFSSIDVEFYHETAACAGSITPDMQMAVDLLSLAVEGVAEPPQSGRKEFAES